MTLDNCDLATPRTLVHIVIGACITSMPMSMLRYGGGGGGGVYVHSNYN